MVFLWFLRIFTNLTSCGQAFIKLSYYRPCALIWGSLRTILKPYWRRLGVIFGLFWGYPRHLGQPKLHFEFNLGQLGPILASGKAPSCMGMHGADLQGALQSGPVALHSVPSPSLPRQSRPTWAMLLATGGIWERTVANCRLASGIFQYCPTLGHLIIDLGFLRSILEPSWSNLRTRN